MQAPSSPQPARNGSGPSGAPDGATPFIDLGQGQNVESFREAIRADRETFERFGSWQAAVEDGYQFGKGGNVPWQKFVGHRADEAGAQTQLDALISMTMDADGAGFDAAKGGGRLSDARVNALAKRWSTLYDLDPTDTAGALVRAGEEAKGMVAKMEATFTLAQRAFVDTQRIASEIELGQLTRWGGDEGAARDAMAAAHQMGADLLASALSMRAAGGRAVRRNRSEFAPEGIDALRAMDPALYAQLVRSADGDPKAMRQLATLGPSAARDWAQFLYVNSLLWGPKTHFINFATNTYMLLARPLERVLGSYFTAGGRGADIRKEAFRQYVYMGNAFTDSFRNAVEAWRLGGSVVGRFTEGLSESVLGQSARDAAEAWRRGDSVLTPHSLETNTLGANMTLQVAQMPFRPTNGLGDLAYNTALATAKLVGVPTRFLGTMDELMKGTVYRSKVMANAYVEGAQRGLKDDDLSAFVSKTLRDAFDEQGRAINMAAIQEARVATFQQDLLPGTVGKSVSTLVTNHPNLRFILPFVRTPTNVLRMGWKMTPVLNMAQTEFRQAIQGKLGAEQQAQAVGQMMMGTSFFGAAGTLVASGSITGGGPTDPNQRKQLMATGWRPYSFVVPGKDGSAPKYVPYNLYDPVALPFGLMADIWDIANAEGYGNGGEWGKWAEEASQALFVGIVKNLSNKSYLVGLPKFLDAVADPDQKGERWSSQLAGSMVPFSAGLRFANQTMGDPYLREARSIVDGIKQNIPGLSASLPARYDTWGDPVTVHPGLWQHGSSHLVDQETIRMVTEEATGFGVPSPSVEGVDLRDITLTAGAHAGKNAYEAYQQLSRQPRPGVLPMKEQAARVMQTEAYKKAPDGDVGTKGTKQAIVYTVISKYRQAALSQVRSDPAVRQELMKKKQAVATAYENQRRQAANPVEAINSAFGLQ